jgi:hypothetical protein
VRLQFFWARRKIWIVHPALLSPHFVCPHITPPIFPVLTRVTRLRFFAKFNRFHLWFVYEVVMLLHSCCKMARLECSETRSD